MVKFFFQIYEDSSKGIIPEAGRQLGDFKKNPEEDNGLKMGQ